MSPTARAAASVLGAGLLVAGGVVAPQALAVVLLLAAVLYAVGWPRLVELPTTRGPSVVVVLAALAALAAVLLDGTGAVAVVAGLAVVAAFVHQMLRRDGRPRLVESVSGVVAGVVVVVTGALWVDVSTADGGQTLVAVAAAGLALAAMWTALPLSSAVLASGATLLAGGAGLLVAYLLPGAGPAVGAAVGAGAGLFTAALHTLLGRSPHVSRTMAGLGAAMLPVLVGSVPAYVAVQLL